MAKAKKVEKAPEKVEDKNAQDPVEEQDLILEVSKMLSEQEDKILKVVETLGKRIDKLEHPDKPFVPEVKGETKAKEDDECPEGIRELVDKMISPKCRVWVVPSKKTPTFTVNVELPKELQSQEDDIRSKTVTYAEGTNGIKDWLDKVKINIWNTFKSRGESIPQVK